KKIASYAWKTMVLWALLLCPRAHPAPPPGADMASGATPTAMKIGIIGGTGLDDPEILEGRTNKYVDASFGKPSDALIWGKTENADGVLLARYGAFKSQLSGEHLDLGSEGGGLYSCHRDHSFRFLEGRDSDKFINRTTMRPQTFYDGSHSSARGVCHIPVAEPVCPQTREVLIVTVKKLGFWYHSKGTVLTIEGLCFSSWTESFMFCTGGGEILSMAGLCYASVYGHGNRLGLLEGAHKKVVSVGQVLKTLKENANKAKSLLLTTIPQIGSVE
uniref:Uncharacterized protein n=1 Tax=Myotis lucifugus TaxID=59463 RepID=G1Q040_MYOLU